MGPLITIIIDLNITFSSLDCKKYSDKSKRNEGLPKKRNEGSPFQGTASQSSEVMASGALDSQ